MSGSAGDPARVGAAASKDGSAAAAASDRLGGARSGLGTRSGPGGGQASGQGPGARPTDTTFRKDHIPAAGLLPQGQIVGSFLVDGPAESGEATIEKGGAIERTVRDLSEKVETEPLPVQQREQVRRFQDLILGGRPATESK